MKTYYLFKCLKSRHFSFFIILILKSSSVLISFENKTDYSQMIEVVPMITFVLVDVS